MFLFVKFQRGDNRGSINRMQIQNRFDFNNNFFFNKKVNFIGFAQVQAFLGKLHWDLPSNIEALRQ